MNAEQLSPWTVTLSDWPNRGASKRTVILAVPI